MSGRYVSYVFRMFILRPNHCLRGAGLLLVLFEPDCYILSNILYGSADEHLSWNFNSHELSWVDPSILSIDFINIEADRAVRKAEGIDRIGVRHLQFQNRVMCLQYR